MSKSMKKIRLGLCFLLLAATLFACKKEVSPTLEITVVDLDGAAVKDAWVQISVDGARNGMLSPQVVDAAGTDDKGEVYFEFDNTVLINARLYKSETSSIVQDSMSVLCEEKRQIGKFNTIERKMTIYY